MSCLVVPSGSRPFLCDLIKINRHLLHNFNYQLMVFLEDNRDYLIYEIILTHISVADLWPHTAVMLAQ